MTGPSGNRPLEIQDRIPKNFCLCASVNRSRNSWGGDPESIRANRSAYYPRDQSLVVQYYQSAGYLYIIGDLLVRVSK